MNRLLLCLVATAIVAYSATVGAQALVPPPVDPRIEARAEALLQKMTLDEKLGQLSQLFWYKGIPDDRVAKGELGSYLFITDPHEINHLQHVAVEQSRLHIPLLIGFDVIHGFQTFFELGIA